MRFHLWARNCGEGRTQGTLRTIQGGEEFIGVGVAIAPAVGADYLESVAAGVVEAVEADEVPHHLHIASAQNCDGKTPRERSQALARLGREKRPLRTGHNRGEGTVIVQEQRRAAASEPATPFGVPGQRRRKRGYWLLTRGFQGGRQGGIGQLRQIGDDHVCALLTEGGPLDRRGQYR